MSRVRIGRWLLTLVLVGGAAMSCAFDWSGNHLLHPLWHPHARYHAAALISLSYWTPFFYVPLFLPGSSHWAGIPGHEPRVMGSILYPNLVVVGFCVLLTVIGWWLGRDASPQ
ncbi:MAG: hypothetical protein EXQ47_09575 [Bryobacterales bacterium]|nr:hypothetical protein [Bryobacterales bacterium]